MKAVCVQHDGFMLHITAGCDDGQRVARVMQRGGAALKKTQRAVRPVMRAVIGRHLPVRGLRILLHGVAGGVLFALFALRRQRRCESA